MKKSTWFLIIAGLIIAVLLVCGGLVALFVWAAGGSSSSSTVGTGAMFGDAVAIVKVEGVIVPGEAPPPNPFGGGNDGFAYSQQVIEHLERAVNDSSVKAILLFVDSPGGSVYASDEIYQKIITIEKPIVTSMASLAASGGYFVAAPTDEIWASQHTFTCSIGVISQFINIEEFSEEYGIKAITVKSGQLKDTGNPFKEFTAADRELWQTIIDEAYDEFVRIVSEGRNMDEAEVREKANGSVCTGKQALELGFVDQLGYLKEAIQSAAKLGGIDGEPRVIEYDGEPSLWEALASANYNPSPVDELRQLLNYYPGARLMYLYTGP